MAIILGLFKLFGLTLSDDNLRIKSSLVRKWRDQENICLHTALCSKILFAKGTESQIFFRSDASAGDATQILKSNILHF